MDNFIYCYLIISFILSIYSARNLLIIAKKERELGKQNSMLRFYHNSTYGKMGRSNYPDILEPDKKLAKFYICVSNEKVFSENILVTTMAYKDGNRLEEAVKKYFPECDMRMLSFNIDMNIFNTDQGKI